MNKNDFSHFVAKCRKKTAENVEHKNIPIKMQPPNI